TANNNTLNIKHINGNIIEAQMDNTLGKNLYREDNALEGILIPTISNSGENLDNIRLNVEDISNNSITIQTKSNFDAVKGISINTYGHGQVKDFVNNAINIIATAAEEVTGIYLYNSFDGTLNAKNISENSITLKGQIVTGMSFLNESAVNVDYSAIYNNNINLTTTNNVPTAGIYFLTDRVFRNAHGKRIYGTITATGLAGNKISSDFGILAVASRSGNRITFIADPNNPNLNPSQANGGALYSTSGDGIVTPKA
ncbi:MAG: hypothetical protein PSV35_00325, partial [bacterium]|nr:hypothetical protein [bacterium]